MHPPIDHPSTTTCPHCQTPSIHTDIPSGDTLCTSCGIVLSSHHLSTAPEWIHHESDEPGLHKSRVGAPVDESQFRGGVMPTTYGRVPYCKTGNSEEMRKLSGLRRRLMKTHALVESMMEREWRERYEDVVLTSRMREAKRKRGEEVDALEGVTCGGDYEEIMSKDDKLLRVLTPLSRKWVMPDAILLYGSLNEVSAHLPRDQGWDESILEKERRQLFKSLDASSRSSASKLYTTFRLLHRATTKLELDRVLSEMTHWLVQYAKKRELKVRGISRETPGDLYTLSLIEYQEWKKTDMHKIRQYAALCSAIIYLAAKKNGKGRTLAEICGAFGVVRDESGEEEPLVRPKYCSKAMGELRAVMPEIVVAPAATVSSTASSASIDADSTTKPAAMKAEDNSAMLTPVKTESRNSFNEGAPSIVSLSSSSSLGPILESSNHNIINDDSSVNTNISPSAENEALVDLTSRLATSLNLPQHAITAAVAVAVQCLNDSSTITPVVKSGRQIRPPIRRGKGSSSMFINSRGVKRASGLSAALKKESSSDLMATASILLVSMAGQKMQTIARQALNNGSEALNNTTESQDDELHASFGALSNPLDDLANNPSSDHMSLTDMASANPQFTPSAPKSCTSKPSSIESWRAWGSQPTWHREVSQIEQCSGVSSKAIISYYSNAIHPRRSHFLDVARKRLLHSSDFEILPSSKRAKTEHGASEVPSTASLLHNITAAAPLISIRGL